MNKFIYLGYSCAIFLLSSCACSSPNSYIDYYHMNDGVHKVSTSKGYKTVFVSGESRIIKTLPLLNVMCLAQTPSNQPYPIDWTITVNHTKIYNISKRSDIVLNQVFPFNLTLDSIVINGVIPAQQNGSPLYVNMQCYVVPK